MMNQTAQLSLMEQVQNMTKAVDKLQTTMYSTALDGGMKFLGKYVRGVNDKGEKYLVKWKQCDLLKIMMSNLLLVTKLSQPAS